MLHFVMKSKITFSSEKSLAKPSGRVLVENANDRLPVNRRLSPIISQFIILSRLEYIVHGDTCLEDIAIMGIMDRNCFSFPHLPWICIPNPGFQVRSCSDKDPGLFGYAELSELKVTDLYNPDNQDDEIITKRDVIADGADRRKVDLRVQQQASRNLPKSFEF
ncbi:hypothetical protein HZH66_013787 [Vespula vulgaris]|uniref:Uncharacterized protein n=1 Tax=Vespula vulgaris TaxID=7454 RepID=A0A834MSK2_VESVU|nr:hypothetical protein HZH66_013787 [Vespula vulgaris]